MELTQPQVKVVVILIPFCKKGKGQGHVIPNSLSPKELNEEGEMMLHKRPPQIHRPWGLSSLTQIRLCPSTVGLSTKWATEPCSNDPLACPQSHSTTYLDREIHLARALSPMAFSVGLSWGTTEIGTFEARNCTHFTALGHPLTQPTSKDLEPRIHTVLQIQLLHSIVRPMM